MAFDKEKEVPGLGIDKSITAPLISLITVSLSLLIVVVLVLGKQK